MISDLDGSLGSRYFLKFGWNALLTKRLPMFLPLLNEIYGVCQYRGHFEVI